MRRTSQCAQRVAALLAGAAPLALALLSATPASAQYANTVAGTINTSVVSSGVGPAVTGATSNSGGIAQTSTISLGAPRTILNWNSFNLTSEDKLNFVFGANQDIVLNRITGGSGTTIHGVINGYLGATGGSVGGNVWFIDRAGIIVGNQAIINVGGLLLSSADVTDADFFNDNKLSLSGGTGNLVMHGNVVATNGAVTLVGPGILFGGKATASGSIALIGAKSAEVQFNSNLDSYVALTILEGSPSLSGGVHLYSTAQFDTGTSASGGRTILATAGNAANFGEILLEGNSADRIDFLDGDVVLYSAANTAGTAAPQSIIAGGTVQALSGGTGTALTAGALNLTGGSLDVRGAGPVNIDAVSTPAGSVRLESGGLLNVTAASSVGRDYFVRAQDFTGGYAFAPNFTGGAGVGDFTIEDTAFGLTVGGFTAPDDLTIRTINGSLNIVGDMTATGGNVTLQATGGDLAINAGIIDNGADDTVSLISSGGISEGASGYITTGTLTGSSGLGTVLNRGNYIRSLGSFAGRGFEFFNLGGPLAINGAVSTTTDRLSIETNGNITVNAPLTSTASSISLNGDTTGANIVLNAPVSAATSTVELLASFGGGTGILTQSASGAITANTFTGAAGGGFFLDTATNQIAQLSDMVGGSLTLLDAGGLSVAGSLNLLNGNATIRTVGGPLTLSGSVNANNIYLSTDGLFNNSAGVNALQTSSGGKWVIYASTPTGSNFNGLDSGNHAVWGGTYATTPASGITGNHYVFAYRPTVTFTPVTTSKVYGTDLSGSTGTLYTVSGLQPGVANAFLADSVADAFAGAPLISSAGLAERASVAGGPYTISAATGTLSALNGYQIALGPNGLLTVTAKALTGTVTANNKTYDGTTAATGSVSLSGVVAGDSVTASALLAFADKNAGSNKTVTISGGSLAGTDAGNYTLSLPASTLASILQKALTVTADAQIKEAGAADPVLTYSITSGELIAGDELTGSIARQPGEAAGAYDILQGTLAASPNYDLSFIGASFTIQDAPASTIMPLSDPYRRMIASFRVPSLLDADLEVFDERSSCQEGRPEGAEKCEAN